MSKEYFVYSNMATGVTYATSRVVEGRDLPETVPGITIKGGVGVADKRTLVTPQGSVVTRVSGEDLARLREDRVFLEHEKNGAIRVSEHKADEEAVASDMSGRDASTQLTPEDYEAAGDTAPSVGAVSSDGPAPKPRNPRKA